MHLTDVGELIAARELNFVDSKESITIMIGKPQPFPNDEGFFCPFRISSTGFDKIKYAAGIDAIQALQLVMPMIRANLKFIENELSGTLHWIGGNTQDPLGFPSLV